MREREKRIRWEKLGEAKMGAVQNGSYIFTPYSLYMDATRKRVTC